MKRCCLFRRYLELEPQNQMQFHKKDTIFFLGGGGKGSYPSAGDTVSIF